MLLSHLLTECVFLGQAAEELFFHFHFLSSVTQGFLADNCAVETAANCPGSATVLSQTDQSSAHVELFPPFPVRWSQARPTCARLFWWIQNKHLILCYNGREKLCSCEDKCFPSSTSVKGSYSTHNLASTLLNPVQPHQAVLGYGVSPIICYNVNVNIYIHPFQFNPSI